MTLDPAQTWERWVGSQSPEEFVSYCGDNLQREVTLYVAAMMRSDYASGGDKSTTSRDDVVDALIRYIEDDPKVGGKG